MTSAAAKKAPSTNAPAPAEPAHLGWRLVALTYDVFPALALVFAGSALMLLLRGGDQPQPESAGAYVNAAWLWAVCGGYFVLSWSRGGQTLGMRPWRLRVVDEAGRTPPWRALVSRYALATVPAMLALGLMALLPWSDRYVPFWIAGALAIAGPLSSLFDRDRRSLYDRFSATRFVRLSVPAA